MKPTVSGPRITYDLPLRIGTLPIEQGWHAARNLISAPYPGNAPYRFHQLGAW